MRHISAILIIVGILFLSVSGALAGSFTFDAGDLRDLNHYCNYTWELNWSVPDGEKIVGASLFFDNIRNWTPERNDLWVQLMDTRPFRGWEISSPDGIVRESMERSPGRNDFAGTGISLYHWQDKLFRPQDITYNFDDAELATLMAYCIDGKFWLGYDPDCHFWNDGVSLTIETAATPIPAPVLLLGTGLIGLAGFRRAPRKN